MQLLLNEIDVGRGAPVLAGKRHVSNAAHHRSLLADDRLHEIGPVQEYERRGDGEDDEGHQAGQDTMAPGPRLRCRPLLVLGPQGDEQGSRHRCGQDGQCAELGGHRQAHAHAGEHRRFCRALLDHQHGPVKRQQGEGGRDGVHGEEVSQLYLQNGESGESSGQQGSAAPVNAAGDEVHQVHRYRIQKGDDHPSDEGKTPYVGGHSQSAHQTLRSADPPGQGSQSVKRVGGDG